MGFLTKLFGKKNRNEDIPAEELPAEQAGEDPDGEGALTAEEEAAAEAAEQAFFAEHPEIAGEDILDEELRLDRSGRLPRKRRAQIARRALRAPGMPRTWQNQRKSRRKNQRKSQWNPNQRTCLSKQ